MVNWLCWHVGTVSDPKLAAVAKRCGNAPKHLVVAVWAYLLEIGASANPKGSIESLDIEGAAIQLDATEEQIVAIIDAMESKGMLGGCQILNWNKRQHGKSTERVKAFRERKKQDETLHDVSATDGNASLVPETPTVQDITVQDRTEGKERERTASPSASPVPNLPAVPDPLKADDDLLDEAPVSVSSKRGARLPPDWMPTADDIAFCRMQRPDIEPGTVSDEFRDYWIAQPGQKGVKLDWSATWRNWIRRQRQNQRPSGQSRTMQALDNIAREYAS